MASRVPISTPVWRPSPTDYATVLREAADLLQPRADLLKEARLGDYKARLERAKATRPGDTSLEDAQLAGARERLKDELAPQWFLVGRGDRTDRPEGNVEEVLPMISMPRPYSYVAVKFSAGRESIGIVMSRGTARIELNGDDAKWLRQAELWARDALRSYRPRWWWMASVPGYVIGVAFFLLVNALSVVPSLVWGWPGEYSLVMNAASLAGIAAFIIAFARKGGRIVRPGESRLRAFLTQGALLVAGAILGQIVAVLWELWTATPATG